MIFLSEDIDPIGKSQIQQQSTKYDKDTGKTKKLKYKMAELVKILKDEKNVVAKENLFPTLVISEHTNNNYTFSA